MIKWPAPTGYRMPSKKILAIAIFVLLIAASISIPDAEAQKKRSTARIINPCRITSKLYGNLRVSVYSTDSFSLTPYYWKDGGKGITIDEARKRLTQNQIVPCGIITGGFNINEPGLREPVDFVEIEGEIIIGRSDRWPIIFEGKTKSGQPYLGIAAGEVFGWKLKDGRWQPIFKDLPQDRRWAIAGGHRIKIIKIRNDKNGKQEFVAQVFGNGDKYSKIPWQNHDPAIPWVEFVFRKSNSRVYFYRMIVHKKSWSRQQRRLVFDWTERNGIMLNQSGTVFTLVVGRSDLRSIAQLAISLGYHDIAIMDSGSALLKTTPNPVYLVVAKK